MGLGDVKCAFCDAPGRVGKIGPSGKRYSCCRRHDRNPPWERIPAELRIMRQGGMRSRK